MSSQYEHWKVAGIDEPSSAHRYAPDGLAGVALDELINRAYAEVAKASRPTSALLDGSAAEQRWRRTERRTLAAVIRCPAGAPWRFGSAVGREGGVMGRHLEPLEDEPVSVHAPFITYPGGEYRHEYAEERRAAMETALVGVELGAYDLHDARHTAATVLLLLQIPDRTVMAIMGWPNTAMAARYQHIIAAIRRDVATSVGGLLWKPAAPTRPDDDDGATGLPVPAA